MTKKKTVDQMSAEELFELAKNRQAEEEEANRAAEREAIDALRAERKEMLARHRKELAALERKLKKLQGKTGAGTRGTGGVNVSSSVLDILARKKKLSTKEIKAELANAGIVANNLSQTLAYLKRQGKIDSPERSVYAMV